MHNDVRELREALGLSQGALGQELATPSGITECSVSSAMARVAGSFFSAK